jgi:hypothetical protein
VLVVVLLSLIACTITEAPQPQLQPAIPNKPSTAPPPQPPKQPVILNKTTHGRIRWNEIWRGEVHITGDIIVERGFTLTIEPGTKVLITANYDEENLLLDSFNMQRGICLSNDYTGRGVTIQRRRKSYHNTYLGYSTCSWHT